MSEQIPTGLHYTTDHEWAAAEGAAVKVGITAFAVEQLGDVTLVNIDVKPGDAVTAGQVFGTIESVKTLSDLFAPVAGTIKAVNTALETKPELVNEDCYGGAWMVVIETAAGAAEKLLDAAAYGAHLKASAH